MKEIQPGIQGCSPPSSSYRRKDVSGCSQRAWVKGLAGAVMGSKGGRSKLFHHCRQSGRRRSIRAPQLWAKACF